MNVRIENGRLVTYDEVELTEEMISLAKLAYLAGFEEAAASIDWHKEVIDDSDETVEVYFDNWINQ